MVTNVFDESSGLQNNCQPTRRNHESKFHIRFDVWKRRKGVIGLAMAHEANGEPLSAFRSLLYVLRIRPNLSLWWRKLHKFFKEWILECQTVCSQHVSSLFRACEEIF